MTGLGRIDIVTVHSSELLAQWQNAHSVVIGKTDHEWMDREDVLFQFGKQEKKSRENYKSFIEQEFNMGRSKELTGAGLIRSLGEWSQVLSMGRMQE